MENILSIKKAKHYLKHIALPFILPTILVISLFTSSIFFIVLPTYKDNLLLSHKIMIKEMTLVVWKLVKGYEQRVQSGELSLTTAQKQVTQVIRSMRYGPRNNNYFWLIENETQLIMHPTYSLTENKISIELKNSIKKDLLTKMVDISKEEDGRYSYYAWPKQDFSLETEQKISYTRSFKPWGWLIGTSFREADLTEEAVLLKQKQENIFYYLIIILFIFSCYIIWQATLLAKKTLSSLNKLQDCRQTVREIELKYRQIMRSMQDGYIEFDATGAILFFNQKIVEILGYSEKSIFKLDFRQHMDRRNIIATLKAFSYVWSTGDVKTEHQCMLRKKGGKQVFFELSIALSTNNKKEKDGFKCIVRDITKHKQNETKLSHLEHKFREVFNSSPSMLICVDDKTRITHCNQNTAKITKINLAHLIGKTFYDAFPGFDSINEKLFQAIKKGQSSINTRVISKFAQENYYSDIVILPFSYSDHAGAIIRIDDVSDRIKMEKMMIQTEKVVSLGGLAAGMAHEINNPLGGISMSMQNIKRRIDPDFTKNVPIAEACGIDLNSLQLYLKNRGIFRFFMIVDESVHHASRIITDMLNYSRQSKSKMLPTNFPKLIDNALKLSMHDYNSKIMVDFKNIKIIKEYASDIPKITCVKTEIQQVLLNLLKNASYAMKPNGRQEKPCIWIRLAIKSQKAIIEIEDNGSGMTEDQQSRIFKPFFTTKPAGSGTGLGLSVSHMIIEHNHNGFIGVESQIGKGTRFIIRLPLVQ